MEEYKIIEKIYKTIERDGLMPTIKTLFGVGTSLQLPFTKTACDTEIEHLDLSVRSYNCLKRAGIHTVRQVIDAMHGDKLWKIRNLGKNSRAEIHVIIYEFGYSLLTERGKKEFVKSLLKLNEDRYSEKDIACRLLAQ